jgi:O-antigen/teichoic acid export membrane protein
MPAPHFNWLAAYSSEQSIKQQSIRGGVATMAGQIASFAINVGSTAIIARLVLPEDYGLIAMVVAFVGIFFIFKDIGFAQLIIQKQQLTQAELSSIFWMNIGIGTFIGLLIAVLAPFVAHFYNDGRLIWITIAFGTIPLLNSLFTVQSALLNRHMFFGSLSKILFVSNLLAVLLTILLAYFNYGYWALAVMNIGSPLFSWLFFWRRCNWRPNFSFSQAGLRENLGFGSYITGFNLVNYLARNFDNILIGKVLGAGPLGIYSKAYQLLMLPISQIRDPITTVGLPALSALRTDAQAYKSYYLNLTFILSFVSVPTIFVLFLAAEPIILIVLGENWLEAAAIFQVMAITALIQPVASTRGLILLSLGATRRYFIWGVWNAVVVIVGFVIGVQYGLMGVAISYAIANYVLLVPSLTFAFKNTSIKLADFFAAMAFPSIFGLVATLVAWQFVGVHHFDAPLLNAGAVSLAFVGVYGALWFTLPKSRQRLKNVLEIAKSLKNGKK